MALAYENFCNALFPLRPSNSTLQRTAYDHFVGELKDVLSLVVRGWCYLFHPLDGASSFTKFVGFD